MSSLASAWRDDVAPTRKALSEAHYALLSANMALAGATELDAGFARAVARIDAANLLLARGKWLYGRATGELADYAVATCSRDDLTEARLCLAQAITLATAGEAPHADAEAASLISELRHDHEILRFRETPIVPSICPIIVLAGSAFDMGRQYANQCVEIFGAFVFAARAAKPVEESARPILEQWRAQLAAHTPEIIELARGLAAGARAHDIPLSEDQALALYLGGVSAPAQKPEAIGVADAESGGDIDAYFGHAHNEGMCSGAAAWGGACLDGAPHFASSTDHDCTFQATIICFPDDGHAFIYTPFSVNGSIPGVGRFGLAGHPGLNSAGLAYVHHGGGGACLEPRSSWGYGVVRGASTWHLLRTQSDWRSALAWELAAPIGDVGRLLGDVGGFYLSSDGGYVLESRDPDHPLARVHTETEDGATLSVLYATNNVLSQDAATPIYQDADFCWSHAEGWRPSAANFERGDDAGVATRREWAHSAASRNSYLSAALWAQEGNICLQSLVALYRRAPGIGDRDWKAAEGLMESGSAISPSVGHRLNAFFGAGSPQKGTYLAAIGPITHRAAPPNRPGHGYFQFDETHTYWELELRESPLAILRTAIALNETLAIAAERALAAHTPAHDGGQRLIHLRHEATMLADASRAISADAALADVARALRTITRAQVRNRQILEAIDPPEGWNIPERSC